MVRQTATAGDLSVEGSGRFAGRFSRMNATQTGLLGGLGLGVAAAAGGLTGFLVALVLGGLGLLIGRVCDGKLDVQELVGRSRDR